jgi:hypothetical protein
MSISRIQLRPNRSADFGGKDVRGTGEGIFHDMELDAREDVCSSRGTREGREEVEVDLDCSPINHAHIVSICTCCNSKNH